MHGGRVCCRVMLTLRISFLLVLNALPVMSQWMVGAI